MDLSFPPYEGASSSISELLHQEGGRGGYCEILSVRGDEERKRKRMERGRQEGERKGEMESR